MPRIIDAFTQFFDDNGDPLVEGFLKFVESGTNNTDKDTFADINETIKNSNPVKLSGAGRCPNIFGTGSYNIISYTSAMVQIQQFDPVSGDLFEGALSIWNAQTIYSEGALVTGSDGLYYRSLVAANQSQDPTTSPDKWEEVQFLYVWNTNVSYEINDIVILDGIFYRSLTAGNIGNNPVGDTANWGSNVASVQDFSESLVKLIHPDQSKGLQELQAQGIYPSSFNQQWGGMGYGGLPDGTLGEVATQSMVTDGVSDIGASTGGTYRAQGFKVGQTTDLNSVWIKLYKAGNPTNDLQLFIYDDSAGDPNALIANGTATAQNGKLHTNNSDGEWVKFTFPAAPSVTGGTQYHIVCKSSGVVDASNNWNWLHDSSGGYPHGHSTVGNATPVWSPTPSKSQTLLIEPVTTILQDSAIAGFDGALHGYEGATLDQSAGFYFANDELNHKRGMIHLAGTGWDKDKTFYDSGVGADNNRIVIRCNSATGFAQVDLYEDDGTKHTVTGTTDISTGNRIVSVGYRSEADGADFLKLYIDGVSEGVELTAQTITLAESFLRGYSIIGGGFGLAPVWTQDLDMSVLPSADGWTWTGTATEANAMVVDSGILYQNGAGYGSTQTGYYAKITTLNNAVGWVVEAKIKLSDASDTQGSSECVIEIFDGAKRFFLTLHTYYMEAWGGSYLTPVQIDLTKETVIKIVGKGSDIYIYADGKLVFDGTGLSTSASATNQINFGDSSSVAGQNVTAQWSYFKYLEGAYLPEYSTMQLSEFANWNDDKSSLLNTVYNSGSIQSVKTLAGLNKNYVNTVKQVISVKGITAIPSTTSTSYTPIPEMNLFCFGSKVNPIAQMNAACAGASKSVWSSLSVDGVSVQRRRVRNQGGVAGSQFLEHNLSRKLTLFSGLHFTNVLWFTDDTAQTYSDSERTRTIEVGSE